MLGRIRDRGMEEPCDPQRFLILRRDKGLRCPENCGICAEVCPMGSVSTENYSEVTGICIKCQACVVKCPEGAKYFDDEAFLSHVRMLENSFTERKEPEWY